MLSVNSIARVVVNAVRSSASPAAFDTGLLLIKDTGFVEEVYLIVLFPFDILLVEVYLIDELIVAVYLSVGLLMDVKIVDSYLIDLF